MLLGMIIKICKFKKFCRALGSGNIDAQSGNIDAQSWKI